MLVSPLNMIRNGAVSMHAGIGIPVASLLQHLGCRTGTGLQMEGGAQRTLITHKEGIMGEFTSGFFMGDSTTNGRILVVDDEADIRKVVRMTLQKAGYDVLEAENGEKAIETINAGENRLLLDVVICDIRMPKINGVEAVAYFRSNYPRVPLIVLTGFPDTDMATSMLRQGVVDYLVKPVEGEKLREAVARAMEQRELAHL